MNHKKSITTINKDHYLLIIYIELLDYQLLKN